MSQRARYNAQSGTTDTWTYAYNNGNEQTSMTLNSGTPETRTYDDWGRLSGRAPREKGFQPQKHMKHATQWLTKSTGNWRDGRNAWTLGEG